MILKIFHFPSFHGFPAPGHQHVITTGAFVTLSMFSRLCPQGCVFQHPSLAGAFEGLYFATDSSPVKGAYPASYLLCIGGSLPGGMAAGT